MYYSLCSPGVRALQEVMQYHQEEMRELTIALYQHQLPVNTQDIFAHVLAQSGSLPRYSAYVLGRAADPGPSVDEDGAGGAQAGASAVQLRVGQGKLALDAGLLHDLQYLHAPGTEVRSPQNTVAFVSSLQWLAALARDDQRKLC